MSARAYESGLFRYVVHGRLEEYLRAGWVVVSDLGPVHGQYAVLCWRCECGEASRG